MTNILAPLALCNNNCEPPANIPAINIAATPDRDGCEIAIALPNSNEAYAYRGTASTGAQWLDCWDSFASIIENCIKDQANAAWVNGPDEYEFFQAGYRSVNDPSSKHMGKGVKLSNQLRLNSLCARVVVVHLRLLAPVRPGVTPAKSAEARIRRSALVRTAMP